MAFKEIKKAATPARGTLTNCADLSQTRKIGKRDIEILERQEQRAREISRKQAENFERQYKEKLAKERAAKEAAEGKSPAALVPVADPERLVARVDGLENKMDRILELLEAK